MVALVLILAWPPDRGTSLGVKALNGIADPAGSLPSLPPPLSLELGDDGDAVAAHDALEADYYRARNGTQLTRWRMAMKSARDPIDPTTERQILIGIAALAVLAIWRLSGRPNSSARP